MDNSTVGLLSHDEIAENGIGCGKEVAMRETTVTDIV